MLCRILCWIGNMLRPLLVPRISWKNEISRFLNYGGFCFCFINRLGWTFRLRRPDMISFNVEPEIANVRWNHEILKNYKLIHVTAVSFLIMNLSVFHNLISNADKSLWKKGTGCTKVTPLAYLIYRWIQYMTTLLKFSRKQRRNYRLNLIYTTGIWKVMHIDPYNFTQWSEKKDEGISVNVRIWGVWGDHVLMFALMR